MARFMILMSAINVDFNLETLFSLHIQGIIKEFLGRWNLGSDSQLDYLVYNDYFLRLVV